MTVNLNVHLRFAVRLEINNCRSTHFLKQSPRFAGSAIKFQEFRFTSRDAAVKPVRRRFCFTPKSDKFPVITLITKNYLLRSLRILVAIACCSSCLIKGQSVPPSPTPPITLDEAIRRAQTVETTYGAAVADAGVAQAQQSIARSLLLPGVVYHNQLLYTQGTQ